ncbi:hypothetical protein ACJX0J_028550, partial [Zea mays]
QFIGLYIHWAHQPTSTATSLGLALAVAMQYQATFVASHKTLLTTHNNFYIAYSLQ